MTSAFASSRSFPSSDPQCYLCRPSSPSFVPPSPSCKPLLPNNTTLQNNRRTASQAGLSTSFPSSSGSFSSSASESSDGDSTPSPPAPKKRKLKAVEVRFEEDGEKVGQAPITENLLLVGNGGGVTRLGGRGENRGVVDFLPCDALGW